MVKLSGGVIAVQVAHTTCDTWGLAATMDTSLEARRRRAARFAGTTGPDAAPPKPKRTFAHPGGKLRVNKSNPRRKFLQRLIDSGKALTPAQQEAARAEGLLVGKASSSGAVRATPSAFTSASAIAADSDPVAARSKNQRANSQRGRPNSARNAPTGGASSHQRATRRAPKPKAKKASSKASSRASPSSTAAGSDVHAAVAKTGSAAGSQQQAPAQQLERAPAAAIVPVDDAGADVKALQVKVRKYKKKLRQIERLVGKPAAELNQDQQVRRASSLFWWTFGGYNEPSLLNTRTVVSCGGVCSRPRQS